MKKTKLSEQFEHQGITVDLEYSSDGKTIYIRGRNSTGVYFNFEDIPVIIDILQEILNA